MLQRHRLITGRAVQRDDLVPCMDVALASEPPTTTAAVARAALSPRLRRFDHVAVTSVFSDPRAPRTWSGAPANLARALERRGVKIESIHPRVGRFTKARIAFLELLAGRGHALSS